MNSNQNQLQKNHVRFPYILLYTILLDFQSFNLSQKKLMNNCKNYMLRIKPDSDGLGMWEANEVKNPIRFKKKRRKIPSKK